jgi:hypothetical protein
MKKYNITNYSYKMADKLGVDIKPSDKKNKKIDVYKNNIKIASIGDVNYKDYPTYLKEDKKLADERRALYRKRHNKDLKVVGSPGYYANKILW